MTGAIAADIVFGTGSIACNGIDVEASGFSRTDGRRYRELSAEFRGSVSAGGEMTPEGH